MRKCSIVGMRFKNVLTCECVNALVSFRNANETSPWGDGNLADMGVIKYFSNFKKSCTICISKKWMYNHKIEMQ